MGSLVIGGKATRSYVRFVRWLDGHWLTILEIIVCTGLLALGVAVGVIIASVDSLVK